MLRTLLAIAFSLFIVVQTNAQVRATTESGNKVLLFDDGTWRYEEKSIASDQNSAPVAPVAAATAIAIDTTKVVETEPTDVFYAPSQRLERYFGDDAANIRCKLSCSNNLGDVKIHFIWEFPVDDGNRYFGWFKETEVTFIMMDDQKVVVVSSEESTIKRYERSSYSTLSNVSLPLTIEQIEALTAQPIEKVEVAWKKKSESYEVENTRLLMNTLPEVF
jgi:hypothetical protein